MIPEAREVHLSRKDRKVLEERCRSPVTLQRDLKRARIVLLAAAGRSTRSIAKEVWVQPRIGGVVNGAEFSDPKFHPVWAKAEELGVPLFIHPQGVPELAKRFPGNGWLGNTIGNPLETTIALSHLIFEGTLDSFPRVESYCRSRWRHSALLCRSFGSCLPGWSQRLQP